MDAVDAADAIVLPIFINQHTAIEAITIRGGTNFHGQVTLAGNAFSLDVEGRFARVCFEKGCYTVNIQH